MRTLHEQYDTVREALAHADIGEIIGVDNQRILISFAADGAFFTSSTPPSLLPFQLPPLTCL